MAASSGNLDKKNIYSFKDRETTSDPFCEYPSSLRDSRIPLVIDNGGHSCRVGWMTDDKPRLIFRNLIAKSRAKKDGEAGGLSIGNDIGNLEMVRWSLRTQFDRDVVTHYDAQEQVFDHIFSHLNVNTSGSVNHPIVLTEPVCNPNYCRQMMSELLFECYSVPQVVYGIDSLFSLYHNMRNSDANALVVSSGYQVTHVLPVLNGHLQPTCRRINVGGAHAIGYMQRLLQLKHPNHSTQITLSRAQELLHDHTNIAVDYSEEMEKWADPDYYDQDVHKIQLPFSQVQNTNQGNGNRSEEKEKLRKQKQGRRLQEINMRRREEKIAEEENQLQQLSEIQELEDQDEDAFKSSLAEAGFQTAESLQIAINNLSESIQKRKEKLAVMQQQLNNSDENKIKKKITPEEDSSSNKKRLADEEDAKIKKLKAEKYPEKEKPVTGQKNQEQLQQYISSLHKRRQGILSSRQQRSNRKQELTKRRSHASIERMRILSRLAHDPNSKDSGSSRVSYKKPKEDTFGMNDEDWLIYREINKEAGDSDSEKEQEELNEIESFLKKYDSNFAKQEDETSGPVDLAAYYQLHVGLETVRVPEIVYQPSLLGIEQAGIAETVQFILNKYSPEKQNTLVKNVFCTGGNTMYKNFKSRLEKELLSIRPFKSFFKVTTAADPLLDAWFGARKWTFDHRSHLDKVSITRSDYLEMGGEYLKEHLCSNIYVPTTVNIR